MEHDLMITTKNRPITNIPSIIKELSLEGKVSTEFLLLFVVKY